MLNYLRFSLKFKEVCPSNILFVSVFKFCMIHTVNGTQEYFYEATPRNHPNKYNTANSHK